MSRAVSLSLIAVLCLNHIAFAAGKEPQQVQWGSLPALIEGREFEAELSNGARIRGQGAKISGQEMQTNVVKTSDAALVPLGPNRLSAQLFDTIKIHRKSVGRRTALGVALGFAGAGAGYLAAVTSGNDGSASAGDKFLVVVTTTLGAVGGAFLGGRHPVTVQVVHDTGQGAESSAVPSRSSESDGGLKSISGVRQ